MTEKSEQRPSPNPLPEGEGFSLPPLPLGEGWGEGLVCWVLTNGMAGFETQAIGVAEALGLTPVIKRVTPPAPYKWLAPHGPAAPDVAIHAPWPDLLLASGRQSIPYARMVKRASKGKTFVTILQNPRVSLRPFDLVWAPAHDGLKGPNVLSTLVSPHRLTRERLAREATAWAPKLAPLPPPRVAVLIGGKNAIYDFDAAAAAKLGHQLAALIDTKNVSLMVTPSRRTGERQTQIIKDALAGKPALVWDGTGANPYFGFLGAADAVIVTSDSVNMVGEAAFTGKPVYVVELDGHSAKFRRFLDGIYETGAARPFVGVLESWEYEPLNATHDIAEAIQTRLAKKNMDTQ